MECLLSTGPTPSSFYQFIILYLNSSLLIISPLVDNVIDFLDKFIILFGKRNIQGVTRCYFFSLFLHSQI